jgi:hypothetical protein
VSLFLIQNLCSTHSKAADFIPPPSILSKEEFKMLSFATPVKEFLSSLFLVTKPLKTE